MSTGYWTTTLKDRDDLEIEVEFSASGGSAGSYWEPPESPTVEIIRAYATEAEGPDLEPTDKENQEIEIDILENYDWDDGSDYDERD